MKNRNNNEWIDNGQPSKFPKPNDGWEITTTEWIDNGHPSKFPEPNDGWGTINSCIW